MHAVADVERVLESAVEDLGFELVDVRWGGSGRRPVLRIRIDREDSSPENGVTVGDCAKVSRALEARLDEHEALSERYVLEVSSPGVERPLKKARDFDRFSGERVVIKGREVLAGRSHRLEGELLGLDGSAGQSEAIRLRLADGDEVVVPRSKIRDAHLIFTWK
ncbi:MAG: ribosome maturation factor RimP [Gemmatimonadota bacterium]|nr:ribosome maturation factor RimP [Gemmatimonadota bacterium]